MCIIQQHSRALRIRPRLSSLASLGMASVKCVQCGMVAPSCPTTTCQQSWLIKALGWHVTSKKKKYCPTCVSQWPWDGDMALITEARKWLCHTCVVVSSTFTLPDPPIAPPPMPTTCPSTTCHAWADPPPSAGAACSTSCSAWTPPPLFPPPTGCSRSRRAPRPPPPSSPHHLPAQRRSASARVVP